MSIYRLAIFFFLFQVAMGIANQANIFPLYNQTQSAGYDTEANKYGQNQSSYFTAGVSVTQATSFGFGDYVFSVFKWIYLIFTSIGSINGVLVNLGFPLLLAQATQTVAWFSYAGALISLVRGYDVRGL